MNYRTASKQQLLAERARLMTAYRRAEQRLGPSTFTRVVGGGGTRRAPGSTKTPQHEVERLTAQLEQIEAELKRREDSQAKASAPPSETAGAEGS